MAILHKTLWTVLILLFASFALKAQTYCTPNNAYGCSIGYIYQFYTTGGTTNITNNYSGCSGGSYGHHTTTSYTGYLNSTVNFYLRLWSYQYASIYADWNNDGDFADAGENVWNSYYSYYFYGSFNIPATATVGTVRMRIRSGYFYSNPQPCGTVYDYGETEDYDINVLSPCASVMGLSTGSVFSKSAVLNWNNTSGSVGYEYNISQSSVPGASGNINNTTANSITVTGLMPGTTYYAHVRNKCAVYSASWETIQFTTSTCAPPELTFANISEQGATMIWNSINVAQDYTYYLDTVPSPPGPGASLLNTPANNVQLTGLQPATTYYAFVRSNCSSGIISEWNNFEFTTLPDCLPPSVSVSNMGNLDMHLSWDPVNAAVAYEYAVTAFDTPPSFGNTVYGTDADVSLPDDGKAYYCHIRTKCVSIFNASEWNTIQLRGQSGTQISNVGANTVEINVYPNPVKNFVVVQLRGQHSLAEIVMSDIAGRIVYKSTMTVDNMTIDMGRLESGVYFLKYIDANGGTIRKIIKE